MQKAKYLEIEVKHKVDDTKTAGRETARKKKKKKNGKSEKNTPPPPLEKKKKTAESKTADREG